MAKLIKIRLVGCNRLHDTKSKRLYESGKTYVLSANKAKALLAYKDPQSGFAYFGEVPSETPAKKAAPIPKKADPKPDSELVEGDVIDDEVDGPVGGTLSVNDLDQGFDSAEEDGAVSV